MRSVRPTIAVLVLALVAWFCTAAAAQDVVVGPGGAQTTGRMTGVFASGLRMEAAGGAIVDLPWRDIASVGGATPVTIAFGSGSQVVGRVVGVEASGTVAVVDADVLGLIRIPVATLAPAPEPPPVASGPEGAAGSKKSILEPTEWNGKVSLTGSAAAGNRDVFTALFQALVQRDFRQDHLEFGALAVYGKSEGDLVNDAQRVSALWRHYYSEDFYAYASLEAGRDSIQDIALELFANVGAGW